MIFLRYNSIMHYKDRRYKLRENKNRGQEKNTKNAEKPGQLAFKTIALRLRFLLKRDRLFP